MKEINIKKSSDLTQTKITIEKNLVIVGANGSGKSRLGSDIERTNSPSKRIAAQRYLQINANIAKHRYEEVYKSLGKIYKNKSVIDPQNDFQQVLETIFAEESIRNEDAVKKIREGVQVDNKNLPKSIKEEIIEIWNFVFPYRTLKLEKDTIKAGDETIEFSGTEMSDGEKVGLYLIAQTILAENDSILIIDEPELHLHKSLIVRLWNKLEESRKDCTFIYITHDLDFATSKTASKLIWIKRFYDNKWDWEEINSNDVIPENLFLEILGSRQPILFVEGEKGSLDYQIYQSYYENFTVVPVGSCEKVIESVKGLKNNSCLHDKAVFGLIDRDFRLKEQLAALENDRVYSTVLNKVENLFLVPEITQMVCDHLGESVENNKKITACIKDKYQKHSKHIEFAARKFRICNHINKSLDDINDQSKYDDFIKTITALFNQELKIELPDADSDIVEILKIYPHKGLMHEVQKKIELTGDAYRKLVLHFFASEKRDALLKIMKKYLPEIKEKS